MKVWIAVAGLCFGCFATGHVIGYIDGARDAARPVQNGENYANTYDLTQDEAMTMLRQWGIGAACVTRLDRDRRAEAIGCAAPDTKPL
jgi:hypothetical protein